MSLWLIAGMSATVWIWALYFLWSGALGDLETAVYFSLVSFTTLGFGDIVLAQPYRLLSGMLAANGLVLFGLTTAVLIDLIRSLHDARRPGRTARETPLRRLRPVSPALAPGALWGVYGVREEPRPRGVAAIAGTAGE